MTRRLSWCATPAFGLLFVVLACASAHPETTAKPPSCAVGAARTVLPESIAVAFTAPVSPAHALNPTNVAERFVAAQAYETLIRVDCDGHTYPGLAASWTLDATKTRVTLVLRDGARFWSGDSVTARDIVAAWRASTAPDSGRLAHRVADATTIIDDRTILVSLPDTNLLVLAEPSLAIHRPSMGARWPMGSGSYRVAESAMDVAPGRLQLLPVSARSPRLMIRTGPDARDAIDAGADLLITGDPAALSYAAAKADLMTVPLPWSRTYALAIPGRSPAAIATPLIPTSDSAAAFRESLARDAVRTQARAAEPSNWWTGIHGCESLRGGAVMTEGQRVRRVVYRADDRVARALAERIIAVGRRATAASMAPPELSRSLHDGSELAYVVELPAVSLSPCADLASLLASARWIAGGDGSVSAESLVPLVDTRETAVVKRDRVSATVDWDGTLRIGGVSSRP